MKVTNEFQETRQRTTGRQNSKEHRCPARTATTRTNCFITIESLAPATAAAPTSLETLKKDLLLLLHRSGYQGECYFTFSYSPIRAITFDVCSNPSRLTISPPPEFRRRTAWTAVEHTRQRIGTLQLTRFANPGRWVSRSARESTH
jgi:hypothetical protein